MIGINHRHGSFSEKWVEYCKLNDIAFKLVDCYESDIIKQLAGCDGLMWHWSHSDYKAALYARQLTLSLEIMGLVVFPSSSTSWHFDDKIGQKYLFEAAGLPIVPSHIFYDKKKALQWVESANYPKVFKLRRGAGSENVLLVNNRGHAEALVEKAFGKGFKVKNRRNFLKERMWHVRRDRSLSSVLGIAKGLGRLIIPKEAEKSFPGERGYVYFQDFIPDNDHDIRVIVIGGKAFAIKRVVRDGDFRASGSGNIVYSPHDIPEECLRLSLDASKKLNVQVGAYDFVFEGGRPLFVEISYAFSAKGYLSCPGYWDEELNWNVGEFTPEFFMIEDFISELKSVK
jgi:glutathione synthase/RimK-type ligase-like ATP-grasp enzyme